MIQPNQSNALDTLEPSELVLARVEAFQRNDFSFVFHSYHVDAPFLQAFPNCRDYLNYAEQALRGAFIISDCRIVRVRKVDSGEVQVLFTMEVDYDGQIQRTLELARIKRTEQGWRYHSGAKRPVEDFSCSPEAVDFDEFFDSTTLVFF